MNPNLLEVVPLAPKRGEAPALILEDIQVNPELAPYLVSSSRSVVWVLHASRKGTIRAGVRDLPGLEAEILASVIDTGQQAEWGNVHPLTTEGVKACLSHVAHYIEGPLEILCSGETNLDDVEIPENVQQTRAKWVPIDALVVVPLDRNLLGTLWVLGPNKVASLVHNASRGMAVAWR